MSLSPSSNDEGLGMPWGEAMFNLPRYQMPGTNVNFDGGFNLSGDMQKEGVDQTGMAPGANIGNVRFSLKREASSDPVKNIINDIQNPLGGVNLSFEGDAAPQPPLPQRSLKEQMLTPTPMMDNLSLDEWARHSGRSQAQNSHFTMGPRSAAQNPHLGYATPEYGGSPPPPNMWSLRSKMRGFI